MLVHGPLQAEQELDDLQEPCKLGDYAMRLPSTQRDLRSLAALMSRWYRKWTADSLKVCSGQERHFRNGIFRTPIDELFAAGQPSDHQAGIACLEFCDMDKLAPARRSRDCAPPKRRPMRRCASTPRILTQISKKHAKSTLSQSACQQHGGSAAPGVLVIA